MHSMKEQNKANAIRFIFPKLEFCGTYERILCMSFFKKNENENTAEWNENIESLVCHFEVKTIPDTQKNLQIMHVLCHEWSFNNYASIYKLNKLNCRAKTKLLMSTDTRLSEGLYKLGDYCNLGICSNYM